MENMRKNVIFQSNFVMNIVILNLMSRLRSEQNGYSGNIDRGRKITSL